MRGAAQEIANAIIPFFIDAPYMLSAETPVGRVLASLGERAFNIPDIVSVVNQGRL